MAVDLKQFISAAVSRVVPTQYAQPVIEDVSQEMLFTLDLSPQAKRIEWLTSSFTLTGVTHPRFDFPVVPIDETHVYRHIGVSDSAAGVQGWDVSILYPAVGRRFLEAFQYNLGTNNGNLLSASATGSSLNSRGGRPLFVYPGGILRVERGADGALNDVIDVDVLREVIGGPLTAAITAGIVASEV